MSATFDENKLKFYKVSKYKKVIPLKHVSDAVFHGFIRYGTRNMFDIFPYGKMN